MEFRRALSGRSWALAVVLAGCSAGPRRPPSTGAAPAPVRPEASPLRFDRRVRDYLARRFALVPTEATVQGVHAHDAELEDLTDTGLARYTEFLLETRRALDALVPELPETDAGGAERSDHPRLDATILRDAVELERLRLVDWDEGATRPGSYHERVAAAVYEPMARDFAPVETRVRAITARLGQVPGLLRAGEARLGRPSRLSVETALRDLEGTIELVGTTFPRFAGSVTDAALGRAAVAAAGEAVRALEAHRTFLRATVLPRADGDFRDGRERWVARARLGEGVTETPEQVRDAAAAEVRRIQDAMRVLARRLARPGESFLALVERLTAQHPAREQLVEAYRARQDALRTFVRERGLATIDPARDRLEVIETPAFARSQAFAALAAPGVFETVDTRTYFWVTPAEPGWDARRAEEYLRQHPFAGIEVTSIHEAWPGHHVQAIHARTARSLVRRVLWQASYGEGWAHYCEQMVVDAGYGDDVVRFFQLEGALVRAARAYLDPAVHVFGLGYDEAARYYEREAYMTREGAAIEARRVCLNPATVFVYTYGKLHLMRLRERVLQGGGITPGRFHDAVLDFGSAPLPALARAVFGVTLGPVGAP